MIQKELNEKDLRKLADGSCFFASGGGGPKQGALSLIDNYNRKPVHIASLKDAIKDEENLSVVIAYMGAPSALNSIKYPTAAQNAFNAIQDYCNSNPHKGKTKIKYLVPVENGVFGMVAPCILATEEEGLSVLDADGAGRAVPKLTMLSMHENGIDPNPVILSNAKESGANRAETILLKVTKNAHVEEIIESIARPTIGLSDFNQIAGLSIWLMDNEDLAKADLVPNTLSLSIDVGNALDALGDKDNAKDKLFEVLENYNYKPYLLGKGIFVSAENHVKNGFDFGTIIFQNEKNTYTVLYQNENLIAWSSNKEQPLAIGPDSICYVTESGLTFSNDDIEFYKKQLKEDKETVYIVGVKAQRQLRGEKIMESFNQALSDMGYYGSNTNT